MNQTRFVAEASSNHGADLERSLAFVDAAAGLGCSAVKFQQFRITELFAPEALQAAPQLVERIPWELPEGFTAGKLKWPTPKRAEFVNTVGSRRHGVTRAGKWAFGRGNSGRDGGLAHDQAAAGGV